jgi:hypothetical protein
MNQLIFHLLATEYNGWPKIKFSINDLTILDYEFSSAEAEIILPLELDPGSYTLNIERYGKTYDNCKVENNVVVRDQTLTLKEIYIDDVKLPNYIKYSGVFCFNNTEHPQSTVWGPNGTFKLPIGFPLVDWAIKEKLNRTNPVMNLFVPLPADYDRFIKNLNAFEQELANVKV